MTERTGPRTRGALALLVGAALELTGPAGAAEPAEVALSARVSIGFADRERAAAILGADDDFTRSFSIFDRAARSGLARAPATDAVRALLANKARDWPPKLRRKVRLSLVRSAAKLGPLEPWLPERVWLVSTHAALEGGAAHTRGTAVILPPASLDVSKRELDFLIAHELFHVVSRAHPQLRDRLYALIGFLPCAQLEPPPVLRDRVITNSDAPRIQHAIHVKAAGKRVWVAPLLLAEPPAYHPARRADLFGYLTLRLFPVTRTESSCAFSEDAAQMPLEVERLIGFDEQTGANTRYVLHPEEIVADNVALLIAGGRAVKTPALLERIRGELDAKGAQ